MTKTVRFTSPKKHNTVIYDVDQPPIAISDKVSKLLARKKSATPKEQIRHNRKRPYPQRFVEPYPGFFDVVTDFEPPIDQECVYLSMYGTGPSPCDCGCNL